MTLKGTRKTMKLKGGDDNLLQEELFQFFNTHKNGNFDTYYKKLKINRLLILIKGLNAVTPRKLNEAVSKKYIGEKVNGDELISAITNIIAYLKQADNNRSLFDIFYGVYGVAIDGLYSQYKENGKINKSVVDNFTNQSYFKAIKSSIIGLVSNGSIKVSDNIIKILQNNLQVNRILFEAFSSLDKPSIDEIKALFEIVKKKEEEKKKN